MYRAEKYAGTATGLYSIAFNIIAVYYSSRSNIIEFSKSNAHLVFSMYSLVSFQSLVEDLSKSDWFSSTSPDSSSSELRTSRVSWSVGVSVSACSESQVHETSFSCSFSSVDDVIVLLLVGERGLVWPSSLALLLWRLLLPPLCYNNKAHYRDSWRHP